jgi:GT2 family glycosyltransferase
VPPEPEVRRLAPIAPAAAAPDDALPHPGCNCGRRRPPRPTTPLLTDDLVIAARERAREPELPTATEQHALATPVTPRLAKYDLVILSGDEAKAEREARIAAECARHEHRVYHLGERVADDTRPAAPTLRRIVISPELPDSRSGLFQILAELRRREGIEAAMLLVPSRFHPALVAEIRERWNWRIATSIDAPAALRAQVDVTIALDTNVPSPDAPGVVALPSAMAWPSRWSALDAAFRAAWPRASVIVLTHDNLAFSRMCVASLLENTDYPNYELIVVDNASTDGTREEMERLARETPVMRLIANDQNAGFGPGNNQGLAAATGDIFVLLNNDTMVPPGWLTRLARHLGDPAVGLVGPATNRTCNEAQIDIPYQTYAEFKAVARNQALQHEGERYAIRMPMMFCTAFRRDAFERIGPLDERYEVGMFEDEDYALRAKAAGYTLVWTPEVYVHHAYHASIGKLLPTGDYMRLVKLNQGRFEEKWGICWERHRPPPPAAS